MKYSGFRFNDIYKRAQKAKATANQMLELEEMGSEWYIYLTKNGILAVRFQYNGTCEKKSKTWHFKPSDYKDGGIMIAEAVYSSEKSYVRAKRKPRNIAEVEIREWFNWVPKIEYSSKPNIEVRKFERRREAWRFLTDGKVKPAEAGKFKVSKYNFIAQFMGKGESEILTTVWIKKGLCKEELQVIGDILKFEYLLHHFMNNPSSDETEDDEVQDVLIQLLNRDSLLDDQRIRYGHLIEAITD